MGYNDDFRASRAQKHSNANSRIKGPEYDERENLD